MTKTLQLEKLKFHKTYFLLFVILFAIEVCIALFIKGGFIRHTIGDVLVVIMVYCLLKSFIKAKPLIIGLFVLTVSFCVEYLQYFDLIGKLNLEQNEIAKLVLGNTFHLADLLAYSVGIIVVLIIESKFSNHLE